MQKDSSKINYFIKIRLICYSHVRSQKQFFITHLFDNDSFWGEISLTKLTFNKNLPCIFGCNIKIPILLKKYLLKMISYIL